MKRIFRVFGLFLALSLVLSSCLSSDESTTTTLYGDAAVTSFTLGSLNRYKYVKRNTTGLQDSLAKTTIDGAKYPMSIDQLKHEIYNLDSLPYGTDTTAVACTIATKNSGGVALVAPDSTVNWYNSSEQVNFGNARTFRIFSTDGTNQCDYKVWLNVKKDSAETFGWKQFVPVENSLFAGTDGHRVAVVGTKVAVFAQKNGSFQLFASTNGADWQQLSPDFTPVAADIWKNVVVKDGVAYLLNGTALLSSTDLEHWTAIATTSILNRLVGNGTKELFAIGSNDSIMTSADNGLNWTTELMDDSLKYLPTEGTACVSFNYMPSDSTDYVLLVGNDGSQTRSWRKLSCYAGGKPQGQWVFMPVDNANKQQLPLTSQLSMVCYDSKVLAVANSTTVYQTRDQGITWQQISSYGLPSACQGTRYSMASDGTTLWLVTNVGQVWQGRKR
jgi:hypothetical protein